jgi:hypothetical protein
VFVVCLFSWTMTRKPREFALEPWIASYLAIDDPLRYTAFSHCAHRGDVGLAKIGVEAGGPVQGMTGEYDVADASQRMTGRQRLGIEDIETRPGDAISLESADKCALVDDAATRGVNEERLAPEQADAPRVEEFTGRGVERAMDRNDIGAPQKIVEG